MTDKFVNHGTAYNIGTEITLERFLQGILLHVYGLYFDSKYKANNGKTYIIQGLMPIIDFRF